MQQIFKGSEELASVLNQYNRMLLVHGKSFDNNPIKYIIDRGSVVHFTDFTSNPLYEDVCKGVDLYINEGCDAIVAIGGGSAIDVAKCIKLFCKMDKSENYLHQDKRDTGIPLIAIPSTAGTGSESTRYAVIYYQGDKQSISHPSIVPDYAFLVPGLLKELPTYQKKCTLLDALCQAIESWWSVNSTDESKEYSKTAIKLVMDNWEEYIFDNSDIAAEYIMEASNYSGRAINITATTAAHAMSYKITSLYKVPHGYAVAVCLPAVWEYMLKHTEECVDLRGEEYLKNTFNEISDAISLATFNDMFDRMDMKMPISRSREAELDILSKSVNPVRLKNNPVRLTEETLRALYEEIVE